MKKFFASKPMQSEVKPVSYAQEQEYKARLALAFEEDSKNFQKRVAENEKYAEATTKKLLEEYKEYAAEEARKMEAKDALYVPAEPNFLVVMLIRSKVNIAPKPKKVLELFRLNSINSAVIIKNNKSTKNMLKLVKNYVAYGYVSYETLRKMIYLRGFGKIGHSKVKLTNENIEAAFNGKFRCIEELVNVIFFGKEGLKEVCNFIWPIALSCPEGGFRGKKNTDFLMGGCTNNHYNLLEKLIERML